ncbi:MAG: helix-turn-helix transcriptional regulator [Candidatus Neomarinimicrobiota bacterium]
METRKIFNRIAILRRDRKLSRVELAQAIGVNFQTIGYLERQDYNPSLDLAFKISEYFKLPLEVIFSTSPFSHLGEELLRAQIKQGDQNEE